MIPYAVGGRGDTIFISTVRISQHRDRTALGLCTHADEADKKENTDSHMFSFVFYLISLTKLALFDETNKRFPMEKV